MGQFKNRLDERITAAAALHGWGKRDLRAQLAKAEVEMLLAEDIIKGKKPLKGRNLRDLCDVLEVPPAWFEAEDWRPLLSEPAEADSRLKSLVAQRTELLATVAQVRKELEALRKTQGLDGHPQGEQNS